MNVGKIHRQVVGELKAKAGTANAGQSSDSYTGSQHVFYAVSVPDRRALLKVIIREHKTTATADEWLQLIGVLMRGASHEEKTMGAYLLGYLSHVRTDVKLSQLEDWLEELVGWAEVDALCQNVFQPDELLADWKHWQQFLIRLSTDTNINKRRAALVFLTGPTSKSDDIRLHTFAYQNINRLKGEGNILITKAISWLLRSMVDTRKNDVILYLKKNDATLPKIAVRETRRKLLTGKKNK